MHAQRTLVSFIGIGSKSAAPLLYSYIRMHPNLYIPKEDSKFFSETKVFQQGIDWYESLFEKSGVGQVVGELAFNYLKTAPAALMIAKTYPSAKLIAVIEDPLVTVRVAYIEARRANLISPKTSLAMFLKQHPEVLMDARYGRQLSQYFSYYSPTNLMVVTATDVREKTLSVLANVYEYIGVDKNYIPLLLQHLIPPDENEIKRKPGIIKRSYRGLKKLIKAGYRFLINKINPPRADLGTASDVARKLPFSPELEAYLKNYYMQDVKFLSNLLQRDLSGEWGIEEVSSKN